MKNPQTDIKSYDAIYKFINNYFDLEKLYLSKHLNDYGEPTKHGWEITSFDPNVYLLDDNTIFRIYNESYFITHDDYRKKLAPILMVNNEQFSTTLNSLFGNKWIPVIKDWIKDMFNITIKTVDYY